MSEVEQAEQHRTQQLVDDRRAEDRQRRDHAPAPPGRTGSGPAGTARAAPAATIAGPRDARRKRAPGATVEHLHLVFGTRHGVVPFERRVVARRDPAAGRSPWRRCPLGGIDSPVGKSSCVLRQQVQLRTRRRRGQRDGLAEALRVVAPALEHRVGDQSVAHDGPAQRRRQHPVAPDRAQVPVVGDLVVVEDHVRGDVGQGAAHLRQAVADLLDHGALGAERVALLRAVGLHERGDLVFGQIRDVGMQPPDIHVRPELTGALVGDFEDVLHARQRVRPQGVAPRRTGTWRKTRPATAGGFRSPTVLKRASLVTTFLRSPVGKCAESAGHSRTPGSDGCSGQRVGSCSTSPVSWLPVGVSMCRSAPATSSA